MVAGVAGTAVMTAFQEFVEMPITKRSPSKVPADLAEKVLRIHPRNEKQRTQLSWATHFALGMMWGTAYGISAHYGWKGAKGIAATFACVWTMDIAMGASLGLYKPKTWSVQDWTVDLVDKFVQAGATGVIYDQVLDPAKR